jgi:hypothetical protein
MSAKIIKINRGDSYSFNVRIPLKEDPSKNYFLTANDVVYFAIMYPHQRFEDALLIKGVTLGEKELNLKTGEITITIEPNDTRALVPGVYYYTVKLQRGGTLEVIDDLDTPDEVRTIIERTKFIINE